MGLSGSRLSTEDILVFYDLYSNDIYRYAYSVLGDSSDALDAVQEVFLRASRSLNKFRGDATPKTWLTTIARNYVIDVIRKRQRDRWYMSGQELPELRDDSASMDIVMEIREALGQMKREYREVLILRHIDELSVQETALTLGWSKRKVRNTSHRAMLKLREILGDED